VVILDDGRRSERSRRGQFAFEAVPSGEHTVTLLAESLPDGALVAGDATRRAALGRDRKAIDLPFLVSIETRAEIRKVFPGKTAAAPRPLPGSRAAGRAPVVPVPPPPSSSRPPATTSTVTVPTATAFVLQIAAFDDPARAREMVGTLQGKGLPAYLVEPPPGNPNAPYRVRIGEYATRLEAVKAAASVGKVIGEKPWVTRDP
jgi:cell division septation protein DedD